MFKISHKGITWKDIKNPEIEDLSKLQEVEDIHNLILRELPVPTVRPKVEQFEDALYMVLHFPFYDAEKRQVESKEIDFVIKENVILTSHFDGSFSPIQEIKEELENDVNLKEELFKDNTSALLYQILNKLYQFTIQELNQIEEKISQVEEDMFEGDQKEALEKISFLRGYVINFSRTFDPQKSVLYSLRDKGVNLFGEDVKPYFTDIIGEYTRAKQIISTQGDVIESLQATNDSLLSYKSNESIKLLTVIGVLVFPLYVIPPLFALKYQYLPATLEHYFWPIVGGIVALDILIFMILKKFNVL